MNFNPKLRSRVVVFAAVLLAGAALAGGAPFHHRHKLRPIPPHPQPGNGTQLGDALYGLNAAQLQAFNE